MLLTFSELGLSTVLSPSLVLQQHAMYTVYTEKHFSCHLFILCLHFIIKLQLNLAHTSQCQYFTDRYMFHFITKLFHITDNMTFVNWPLMKKDGPSWMGTPFKPSYTVPDVTI